MEEQKQYKNLRANEIENLLTFQDVNEDTLKLIDDLLDEI